MTGQLLTHPFIHFAGKTGYSRHGESVGLFCENIANVNGLGLSSRNLVLQLWACNEPYHGVTLAGRKVAEYPLGVLDANHYIGPVEVTIDATLPPAGEYAMVLVVAEWDGNEFDRIHDYHNYPDRDTFIHPRLGGLIGYHAVDDGHIIIDVGSIENPRNNDNVSGTLSLELWALTEPYTGDNFTGHWLTGVTLGTLGGGAKLLDNHYDLTLAAPPDGTYSLVLLLREWANGTYITRDYTVFGNPVSFPFRGRSTQPESSVGLPRATPAPEAVATLIATNAREFGSTATSKKGTPPAARVESTAKQPNMSVALAATTASTKDAKSRCGTVSINEASAQQLATVKGLTKILAQRITQQRPFTKLEDLLAVKGIGKRLLDRLKDQLRI